MSKSIAIASFVLLAACGGGTPVVAPTVAHVEQVKAPEPPPEPAAPADDPARFPAGRGVELVLDQLLAASRDRSVSDRTASFDDRLAAARKLLGTEGEPVAEGVAFRGVSAKGAAGPWGCHELVIVKNTAVTMSRSVANTMCGLPFLLSAQASWYSGPGPRRTVARLTAILPELTGQTAVAAADVARKKLGKEDAMIAGEAVWFGIGARGPEAPVSCHTLRIGSQAKLEPKPLGDCGLEWPMPNTTFDPGPAQPPASMTAALAQCSTKCTSKQVCVVDERYPMNAQVRTEGDGLHARYADGRPASLELVPLCAPIPAKCSPLEAACFFPRSPVPAATPPTKAPAVITVAKAAGPCPNEFFSGYAFSGSGPQPYITCYSRLGYHPVPETPLLSDPLMTGFHR